MTGAPGLIRPNVHAHSSQALKVPKSDLRVIQGLKSKDKIVELAVHGRSSAADEQGNDLVASMYKRLAGQANAP